MRRPGVIVTLVRRGHLLLGLGGLLAFIATGQYMDRVHHHLHGMPDGPRLLFRSAHIYLLFASLLNLLLGATAVPAPTARGRALQGVGSVLLAVGPFLFLLAFFREPWLPHLVRPYARNGIYAALAGTLLHAAAVIGRRGISGPGPL